jgi:hypothetical protein
MIQHWLVRSGRVGRRGRLKNGDGLEKDELRNKEGGGEEHKEMVENEMGHGNMVLGNEELNKLHNDIN